MQTKNMVAGIGEELVDFESCRYFGLTGQWGLSLK